MKEASLKMEKIHKTRESMLKIRYQKPPIGREIWSFAINRG